MLEHDRRMIRVVRCIDADFMRFALAVDQHDTDAGRGIADNLGHNTFHGERHIRERAYFRQFGVWILLVAFKLALKRLTLGKLDVTSELGVDADNATEENQKKTDVKQGKRDWRVAVFRPVEAVRISQDGVAAFAECGKDPDFIQVAGQRI